MHSITHQILQQARRRLLAQATLRAAAWAWLVGAAGLFVAALLVPGWRAPAELLRLGGLLFVVTTAGAAIYALCRQPSLQQVAARLDRKAKTHDRLATALALHGRSDSMDTMESAALGECEHYLNRFTPGPWLPWQFPRMLGWLVLPLAGFLALQLPGVRTIPRDPDPAVLAAAKALEQMAKQLETKPEAKELGKVADALKKSAQALREQADEATPDKTILRELSAAEQAMKQAQQAGEMEALAEAMESMASQPDAAEAIEALRQQNAAKAAQKMEALAEALASQQDAAARKEQMAQLQKAMEQAAQKLGEKSPLGQSAAQAAEAARRGDSPGTKQAMNQMGQNLRESRNRSSSSSGQGQTASAEELERMLAALQSMKEGQGQGKSQPGEGESPMASMIQPGSGSKGEGEGQPLAGGGDDSPGGKPGSEMDQGSKATPYGNETPPPSTADLQSQIEGLLGEGQSLHTLLPTRSGEGPARTGYRELYEAAAPAAEDALNKENIPAGSRLTIKRYFESIRPSR